MHKAFKEIGFFRLIKYFIFGLWELIFRLLPYSPLRVFWLRLGGASIGKNCVIESIKFFNLDRTGLKGLKIENECHLGIDILLDLADEITLNNQVTISPRSIILTHFSVGFNNHPLLKHYSKKVQPVLFQSGCALGVASIILPGITIGKNSLIAAGAVVRKSVPACKMVAGVPAEIKKSLHEKKS